MTPAPDVQERAERSVVFGLPMALAALALFAWLAFHVARSATIGFDAGVREFVHSWSSPGLTALAQGLSQIGSPDSLLILGLGAILAFIGLGWRRAAVRLFATLLGALALDLGLKLGFHRARPVSFFGTPLPGSYSFPSGHALYSACFFGALAALVTARIRSRPARAALWCGGALLALAIGWSRIYLGVHYPSDVLAGYAVAVIWISAIAHADKMLHRRDVENAEGAQRRSKC